MKILSIENLSNLDNSVLHDIINETLKSGSYNESLYYQYNINVNLKKESKKDYLLLMYYRAFWTSINDHKEIYASGHDEVRIRVSLMTAIEFIYEATPPLLQSKIKELITSIENIIEILNTYLLEGNPEQQLREGLFFKKIGMYEYGAIWNDSNDKTKMIHSIVDKMGYKPHTIAYVDADIDDYRQYIVSFPYTEIKRIYDMTMSLKLTHVFVDKTPSVVMDDIVNIKGYVFGYQSQKDLLEDLDTECSKTLKMLE